MDKQPKFRSNNLEGSQIDIVEREPYTSEELEKRKRVRVEQEKLADEVCLKYKKGDNFTFSLEKIKKDNQSSFVCDIILDGVEVGSFRVEPGEDGQDRILGGISLNKNLRNKGFGKVLYISLNDYLKKVEGSVLKQSYQAGEEPKRVWESLFKEGLVEVVPENSLTGYEVPWIKNHFLPKGTKLYRFKK